MNFVALRMLNGDRAKYFDGNLPQIMPWPIFQNMSERDIRAIYEYLSAVPCIEGPPPPSVLHIDCQ